MKSTLFSVLLLALAASTGEAAVITWGAATTISGDNDVSANGAVVGAFNLGEIGVAATTINGTTFSPLGASGTSFGTANFNFSTTNGFFGTNFVGSASAPFANLSASYRTLLGSEIGTFLNGNTVLTMSGLTTGQAYEFQWWYNESTSLSASTTTAVAGNSVSLSSNATGGVGGVGQYAIGTFTADGGGTEVITFTDVHRLNGFQLRQLGTASVPDSATTVGLFGLALTGLVGLRRKLR